MKNEREWILDILDAIEQIEKYAVKGEEEYSANELIQKWMIFHLQIIGEASSKISDKIRSETPSVPWRQIIGLRNIIVHEYFGIDPEEIWNTIVTDIPGFKVEILKILDT